MEIPQVILCVAGAFLLGFWCGGQLSYTSWRAGRFPVKDYEDAIAKRKWRETEPKGEAQ